MPFPGEHTSKRNRLELMNTSISQSCHHLRARPIPQSLEGQIVVVQADVLMKTWKIIPDLATWRQCFMVYVAALIPHQPSRLADLMAYQSLIARASQKYKWPT